ncbi:MAG: hypothetical protein ABSE05_05500 [Syntrophales bacterium]
MKVAAIEIPINHTLEIGTVETALQFRPLLMDPDKALDPNESPRRRRRGSSPTKIK